MAKFLQELKDLSFKQVKGTFFTIQTELTFISDTGRRITVPAGFDTNFYSNPIEENTSEDVRPAIIHDFLCHFKGYICKGVFIPISFDEANNIFYEALKVVGIPWWKRLIYRLAVDCNKDRW